MPDSTLTLQTLAAFTGVMLVAAAIPSVSVLAVGAPKLVYAFLAGHAGAANGGTRAARVLNRLAGSVMIGVGVLLFMRA
jgi:threonine/homoserine/homoserine lactone efflux protein